MKVFLNCMAAPIAVGDVAGKKQNMDAKEKFTANIGNSG